jgi:hypothetical protein
VALSRNEAQAGRQRFAWLLSPFGAPEGSASSLAEAESACSAALSCWQVLPAMEARLLAWLGSYADTDAVRNLHEMAVGIRTLAGVQETLKRRFTRELDSSGVPYVLLKGSATGLIAYPQSDLRCGLDVDIGVPADHLQRAEDIARAQGYVPASLDETGRHFIQVDDDERRAFESTHYELACLVRKQVIHGLQPEVASAIRTSISMLKPWHVTSNDEIGCYVTLDVHHGLCLDIEVDPLVESAERWRAGDYSVLVPRPEWLVFHLIFKIYWEGVHNYRKGAYQYADILRLLPLLTGSAAAKLIELLSEYSLEAAGYYVLRRVESEFGGHLNHELRELLVLQAEAPTGVFPNEVNDAGDMWPKLWGIR